MLHGIIISGLQQHTSLLILYKITSSQHKVNICSVHASRQNAQD